MTANLFRQEAVNARRGNTMGGVALTQPWPIWLGTVFAGVVTACIFTLLIWGDYTRRTRVAGHLYASSGMSMLVTPVNGTLSDVAVREGDHVERGARIAVIRAQSATRTGDTLVAVQQSIAARRAAIIESYASKQRQAEAEAQSVAAQLRDASAELGYVDAELRARTEQLKIIMQSVQRYQALRQKQFITDLQLQEQQTALLEQQASIHALQRSKSTLHRQLTQYRQAEAESIERQQILETDRVRELAALDREAVEADAMSEAVITAPVTGTVSTLSKLAGQTVQAGQVVVSLLPEGGSLEAHLFVPSDAVGFISKGDTVMLRVAAFPYQKFGQQRGRVIRVSRAALAPSELTVQSAYVSSNAPLYRVVVELERQSVVAYGADEPLLAGMQLEADILGESRSLWEWVLEPVFSVSGRMLERETRSEW